MNRQIAILRDAVTKIVPMIAGKGIRVTQLGAQAFVRYDGNGKIIQVNIPHLPDNADDALILAIQGFIDHEVGHVLFTDPKSLPDGGKRGAELAEARGLTKQAGSANMNMLANIVEDPFVEREMQKRFPGSHFNLARLYDVFLEKLTIPALAKSVGKPADEFGVLLVPIVRAWAGQKVFQDFLAKGKHWDHPLVKAFTDEVSPALRARCASAKNSTQTLDVAEEFFKILHPEKPPAPPAPAPKNEEQQEGSSSGKPGEGQGGGKGASKKKQEQKDDADAGEKAAKPEKFEKNKDDPAKSDPDDAPGSSGGADDDLEQDDSKSGADGEEDKSED
jgi:hypothetical protein